MYFVCFLLATDITVPAKFCSISWAALHKNIVPLSTLIPLFLSRNTICVHSSLETLSTDIFLFESRKWALVALVTWDVVVCVFIHGQIMTNEEAVSDTRAVLSVRSGFCAGSCGSFLTPPCTHFIRKGQYNEEYG